MRKKILLVTAMCMFVTFLTACNKPTTASNTDEPISKSGLLLEEPSMNTTYSFDSVEQLFKALTMKDTDAYNEIRPENKEFGKLYEDTLSAFENGKIKVIVPQLEGRDMRLSDRGDGYRISLYTSGSGTLPQIWYHYMFDDIHVMVICTYVSVLGDENVDNAKSAVELQNIIWPHLPTPENYKQHELYGDIYEELYEDIYEKELELANGIKVKALIEELKEITRRSVRIYHDGILIDIMTDRSVLTDEFLNSFGIAYYE